MSNINTIIEEQKEEFYEKFSFIQAIKNEQSGNAYTRVFDWHIKSIKQILEAEIERLKGMKKEIPKELLSPSALLSDEVEDMEAYNSVYNQAIDDQITHLTNIIKEIK